MAAVIVVAARAYVEESQFPNVEVQQGVSAFAMYLLDVNKIENYAQLLNVGNARWE